MYIEVIIAVAILGMVMIPLYTVLKSQANMRYEIRQWSKVEVELDEIILRVKEKLKKGLQEGKEWTKEVKKFKKIYDLSDVLEESFLEMDRENYIYELGIIRVEEIVRGSLLESKEWLMKWSSEGENPRDYQLIQALEEKEIIFEFKEVVGVENWDILCKKQGVQENLRGQIKIEGGLRNDKGELVQEIDLISQGITWGKVSVEDEEGIDVYTIQKKQEEKSGRIEVEIVYQEDKPLKIVNQTLYDLQVNVRFNNKEVELEDVEDFIQIQNTQGRTFVVKSPSLNEESFIIVLLVREKVPLIGNEGKKIGSRVSFYGPGL